MQDHLYKAHNDDSSSDSNCNDNSIREAIARLCEFLFLIILDTGDENCVYKVHRLAQEAM